jgi:DNA-directed RNA polymerase subunit beta
MSEIECSLIGRVIHNFNIKANDLLGRYKRKKFHISVGDELPAGIEIGKSLCC